MLEILEYSTSSLGVFLGCLLLTNSIILSIGWAINAMSIGMIHGKKCSDINLIP